MSSPPETDRNYAYFRAVGEGDTTLIEESLGITPNERWNVSDVFERGNRKLRRRSSCWQLDSGHNDNVELEVHIESLLSKLEIKKPELIALSREYKIQIVCVSFVYQSFSFELPFEMQKLATSLGISFWFDSYSFGDLHDEVTELREQLDKL